MRRVSILLTLLAVGFALVLGLGIMGSDAGAEQQPIPGPPVNMRIPCVDGALGQWEILPDPVRVSRGNSEQIAWHLLGGNNAVSSAEISPKEGSIWPFDSAPPLTVTRGQPTYSGAIRAEVANDSYYYDVTVSCGVIDPQMDIDP